MGLHCVGKTVQESSRDGPVLRMLDKYFQFFVATIDLTHCFSLLLGVLFKNNLFSFKVFGINMFLIKNLQLEL